MSESPSPKVRSLPPWPEKRDRKRAQQTKVASAGLEGFVDWTGILTSEYTKEEEMFMITNGFATRMRKKVADLEDEYTPISNGKHRRRSSPDEEA